MILQLKVMSDVVDSDSFKVSPLVANKSYCLIITLLLFTTKVYLHAQLNNLSALGMTTLAAVWSFSSQFDEEVLVPELLSASHYIVGFL